MKKVESREFIKKILNNILNINYTNQSYWNKLNLATSRTILNYINGDTKNIREHTKKTIQKIIVFECLEKKNIIKKKRIQIEIENLLDNKEKYLLNKIKIDINGDDDKYFELLVKYVLEDLFSNDNNISSLAEYENNNAKINKPNIIKKFFDLKTIILMIVIILFSVLNLITTFYTLKNYPLKVNTSYKNYDIRENNKIFASSFIEDINFPDNTIIESGKNFNKGWKIRNNGTITWDKSNNFKVVKVNGIIGKQFLTLPLTKPGELAEIWTDVISVPKKPGKYKVVYQLEYKGKKFGTQFWLIFKVK